MAYGSSSYGSVSYGGSIEEAAAPPAAIMKQFQKSNIGADLYNGAIIA